MLSAIFHPDLSAKLGRGMRSGTENVVGLMKSRDVHIAVPKELQNLALRRMLKVRLPIDVLSCRS